jgi:hypothetical protein
MQTFKQWIKDTYEADQIEDIQRHGCEGGVSGMIYYTETTALYDQYADEMHEVIGELTDQIGFIPEYVTRYIGSVAQFKNAIVWVVAEWYAGEIVAEAEEITA